MYFKIKNFLFYGLKYMGIYDFFSFLNRNSIPILCYHGVSTQDEHEFMPSNFIKFKTFKKRIEILEKRGYKIISLEQACDQVKNNSVQGKNVVLTIDDGFYPIFDELIPYLIDKRIPITCYITSYKSQHETPIFRLLVQYIFWKAKTSSATITSYTNSEVSIDTMWDFINFAESNLTREQRLETAKELAQKLNVPLNDERLRAYSIANKQTLKEFGTRGLDLQLHTHKHNMNLPLDKLKVDIQKNKDYLSGTTDNKLVHFCYPSGVWKKEHFDILKGLGVQTATTCDDGFLNKDTNLFSIPRIIDSENISSIVFESELSGFGLWIRKLFSK